MEPVLTYENVTISYDQRPVVHDVSFSVHPGEVVAIVGESGSGKSTLLKAAMGLLGPRGIVGRGDIWFKGLDIPDVDEATLRPLLGQDMAMIWQDAGAALCPIRTIGDQCVETVRAHQSQSVAAIKEQTLALFAKLGLSDGERIWQSYAFELSGGMNQRVGIAMAMLLAPEIILADEPTSALDVYTQQQVLQAMERLRRQRQTAMVIVTHDMAVVKAVAQTVVVLQGGHVVEQGPAAQILQAPQHGYTQALLQATPILGGT